MIYFVEQNTKVSLRLPHALFYNHWLENALLGLRNPEPDRHLQFALFVSTAVPLRQYLSLCIVQYDLYI